MFTLYAICAAIGGTIMVVQLLLTLLGLSHDSDIDADAHVGDMHFDTGDGHLAAGSDAVDAHFDADHAAGHGADHVDHDAAHHGASWFFGVLSFRAMVAAIAFFGLAGIAGLEGGLHPYATLLVALAAGGTAMIVIAWLMRTLGQLTSEGNVYIETAVGGPGTCYLRIPGHNEGAGKVTVKIQGRTMEYRAVTEGEPVPTGAAVIVKKVVGTNTLEVAPATSTERS